MTESPRQSEPDTVPEEPVPDDVLPHGALPPMTYRDLPEAIPVRKMIGPSIILAGLALGSGEFILWPYITYKTQFVFFWACLLGVTTQYFLNMEITRWSLATGESAITGFARLSRHWAWIFLALNILPHMIPAWSKGAAQVVSWLIWGAEFDEAGNVQSPWVNELSIAGLLFCGIVLTAGKVVYETVERIQLVLVSLIMLLVVVLAVWLVRADSVVAQLEGAVNFGGMPEGLDPILLLGALAFAGAGGTLNLSQSNYVKDKGYGMGRFIGRITSPITGQEEAISEIGYHFRHTPENLSRWRRWWRAAGTEHFLSFFVTCAACLVLLTLISHSIFYTPEGTLEAGADRYGKDMNFIWGEAVELGNRVGPAVKILFLIMGVAILLTTEFGVLDASSRVSTDVVKVNWLRDNERWSESKLYYIFLWTTILVGIAILLIGEERAQALTLFKFTSAMNGGVMFIYSCTLLYLNRFKLPAAIRMKPWRTMIMIWSVFFFGYFAVRSSIHIAGELFSG